jgi:hypothetical protein
MASERAIDFGSYQCRFRCTVRAHFDCKAPASHGRQPVAPTAPTTPDITTPPNNAARQQRKAVAGKGRTDHARGSWQMATVTRGWALMLEKKEEP